MNPQIAALIAKNGQPLRRELPGFTPKVINEDEGLVRYVASDETLDSYREIVRVVGWRFTHFAKNAPFVDSHDYSSIRTLLGQVVTFGIESKQLVEDVKYSRQPGTFGEWAFKMVRDGFLRAVSVGFIPLRAVSKWDADPKDFVAQVQEMSLDASTAAQLRVVYLEQEQIELSQCVIGANPNALAKAYRAGTLSDEDVHKFSAAIVSATTVTSAETRADAEATRRRRQLALLAEIQTHL